KHCVPVMKDMADGGSVINISSVAGLQGAAGLSAYNATKGGVRLFTKGVALECARNQWPVRVNSVHPGIIATPIWDKIDPTMIAEGANNFDPQEMSAIAVPTGVAGEPVDIANGVLFLASDESRYMTGSELVIDGGISA
ncbi:MAG: SDR family oxidoreductase, partial [Pseudomonadota bacterium]|nr:SDR family oxidoreductase [Pseudomonadota bacterium]